MADRLFSKRQFIEENPLIPFLRSRGIDLFESGDNFITGSCPIAPHQKPGHRPVSIDSSKQVWYCNDHKQGGSIINWIMFERSCTASEAMSSLNGASQHEQQAFVCAYDYLDEQGSLLFQSVRFKVPPPQNKTFRQRHRGENGDWIWNTKGVRRVLYHLPQVLTAETVLVVEGEKDADALAALGFVATTNVGGAGKWRGEYSETLKGKNVVVFGDIGDADKAGEKHVNSVLLSLVSVAKTLKHAIQPAHDVSDWLKSLAPGREREAVEKLISETAVFKPHTSTPLKDCTSYLNGDCPIMPPEIIQHMLHQGSKLILGGTSKARKSMSLIDLAVSTVVGGQWWGFHTKKSKVCYINFELQEPFFAFRMQQICTAKGISELPPEMLYAWHLRGHADAIEHLMPKMLAVLTQTKFGLIIIDPIYKALGGRDENRAGDVAAMLNQVEKIAVDTGAAVAFGAHFSKGNQAAKESIDRIGGSGVFARDPDSILTMTPHEQFDAFTVEATLRNFKPLQPFVVRWEWPVFVRDEDLDPGTLKGGMDTDRMKYDPKVILDVMSIANGLTVSQIRKELDDTGIPRATFFRYWDYLQRNHKIKRLEGRLWIKISED